MSDLLADDYDSYLRLDLVLGAQQPLSDYHDELLFIVGHQAAELWMKVVIDELGMAKRRLAADHVGSAVRAITRAGDVFDLLARQWGLLETITPNDYRRFRHYLGKVGADRPVQPAAIDILLGRRNPALFEGRPADERVFLGRMAEQPSLYDDVLGVLHRRGLGVPARVVDRDFAVGHEPSEDVVGAWVAVYADPPRYWEIYELGEHLLDLLTALSRWRAEQETLGARLVGETPATRRLPLDVFPDLWLARTRM